VTVAGAVHIPVSYAHGWRADAIRLAAHAWERLVNRTDVWGRYGLVPQRDGTWKFGAKTAPRKEDRGRVALTATVIERHFLGRSRYDVMGLHTTGDDGSLFGALDIDAHEKGPEIAERNLEMARRAVDEFRSRGLEPLLEDSNGAGGYHVWMFFEHPVPTRDLFVLLTRVIAKLGIKTETYPKQPERLAYGNWLRLPGRHHSKDHWSRIEDRGQWLGALEGPRAWMSWPLSPPSAVPAAPPPPPPPVVRRVPYIVDGDMRARRIAAYERSLPTGLSAGQQRSDVAFNYARFLLHACALSDAETLAHLHEWNRGNATPLSEEKLEDTIANAHRYNTKGAPARAWVSALASIPARRL
jgi:hypothetical protein